MKAHSGIAGNECADAIAKHSALHDEGHDMHFQPPTPDGNAYTSTGLQLKTPMRITAEEGQLHLGFVHSDIRAKLKTEMCKSHRLGSAETDTGYCKYWKDLRPLVNKQATNAF